MENIFIVFEGLSGSGKTTVGRIVADRLGAVFIKTPTSIFSPIRDEVDKKANKMARFLFYLATVVQASEEISSILKEKSVVCDRYLLTTLCWHRAIGVSFPICEPLLSSILQPHHTFLVTCKNKIRLQRLFSRGLSYNDQQERNRQTERRFLNEYMKHGLIKIDNSGDDPRKAADRAIKLLKNICNL